ncbi:unnamed protein product [Ranitomeya imitator]|uniref:Uncharacterized protein n=1 Tax=Ranitomeya imitator TaxID=111125 RepID=A0ABN9M879_9NEOB|nr:unnamed protein product [Ranitomeya imitator]
MMSTPYQQYKSPQKFYQSVTMSSTPWILMESLKTPSWLERVVIIGATKPKNITLHQPGGSEVQLDFDYDAQTSVITVRKPGVNIASDFTISLR